MHKNYAHAFAELIMMLDGYLTTFVMFCGPDVMGAEFPVASVPVLQHGIEQQLIRAADLCGELHLRSASALIARARADKPWAGTAFAHTLKEVRSRILDDLKNVQFQLIPESRLQHFDGPYFGEHVERAFPSAVDDMREAGTCFALGRWNAVAYHSMGVMQVGLVALARHLKCQVDLNVETWDPIINKIVAAVESKRQSMPKPKWKLVEPFYDEVTSDLRALKNAYRNTIAHYRRSFDEPQAHKVLERVRELMQRLATKIKEPR